ncbi:MAG: lysine--tRNA ligase [Alphaproteobacteria bacterium]
MTISADILNDAKSWCYEEAKKVVKRIGGKTPEKGYVLFQTGYGPSGLPHIGTFGEVCRTTMVMNAFKQLTNNEIPTKIICFSDDMDGFRKVPENVPNGEELAKYLNKPLTKVMDPFGCCEGFAQHNNKLLCEFLDSFEFEYEFASSTEYYTSGKFDEALIKLLENYDKVQNIMLPTLGEERRATYSPFLPICPESGNVLQVPVIKTDVANHTIVYKREDGVEVETKVTGGACKLQWKPDWALRWYALDVDYEMCGKDLKPSVDVSSAITKVLGGKAPENLVYELFLDEEGGKISKSKGNGLAIEEWLKYAPQESLSLFMYQKPKTAKKLYFDVIPKAMDEYLTWVEKYPTQEDKEKADNPAHHIHGGNVPNNQSPVSFALLLNLAGAANASDADVMWGFISRYAPEASPEKNPKLAQMVEYAIRYYQDFVKPKKEYRPMTDEERPQFEALKKTLEGMKDCKDGSELQTAVFSVGKEFGYEKLGEWFSTIYQVLLGQKQGPRMGSFISLYGVEETIALIDSKF